jgi:ATP-dependent Clp protease adaptor protein ClpS
MYVNEMSGKMSRSKGMCRCGPAGQITMSSDREHRGDEGLAIEEAKPRLKEPSMYKVFLLNDDYTPMEFVVDLLEKLFGMDREKATRIMLQVHSYGKGVCGVYTYEIAETKVAQVGEYAQRHQHPLMCSMEEA